MNNWPEDFLQRMKEVFGNEYNDFIAGLSEPSPISIRKNPFKQSGKFLEEESIPWSSEGVYLKERPSFTLDPLFHAGSYYVQEAGSQFLEQLFLQAKAEFDEPIVLDLCAAPGGKSTHLLSLMNNAGLLVSNEIISSRNKILQQNISKWGCVNSIVIQNSTEHFSRLPEFFDIIVVDAPCSGEGLFRRDPEAANEWSLTAVDNCAIRQRSILSDIQNSLKPGGFLIYSTCTYEPSENQSQINQLVNDFGYTLCNDVHADYGIVQSEVGYHFYPYKVRSEGFFVSMLRKPFSDNGHHLREEKIRNSDKSAIQILQKYFENAEDLLPFIKDDRVYALPKKFYTHFFLLNKNLFIRQAGIFAGTIKGKDFLPSQELALANSLKKEFPVVDVDLQTALTFLRCDLISLPDSKLGWTLISFEGFILGWVKVLDRRVNNYYPKEWRIFKKE